MSKTAATAAKALERERQRKREARWEVKRLRGGKGKPTPRNFELAFTTRYRSDGPADRVARADRHMAIPDLAGFRRARAQRKVARSTRVRQGMARRGKR